MRATVVILLSYSFGALIGCFVGYARGYDKGYSKAQRLITDDEAVELTEERDWLSFPYKRD
jgi:hypothetical protein